MKAFVTKNDWKYENICKKKLKNTTKFICMKLNQNSIAKVCTTNSKSDKIYL
jgi:hypothetical protein